MMPLVLLVLLAVALVLVVRGAFLGYPPAQLAPGSTLSRKEQAVVAAVGDALFPPSGPIAVSGTQAGLVGYMDDYVRRVPAHTRTLMRLLFAFLEYGPWVFGLRSRFTQLPQEDRIAALARMSTSPIYFRRVAFLSIRTVLCMGYLASEDVQHAIGLSYRTAPFEAPKPPRNPPLGALREVTA